MLTQKDIDTIKRKIVDSVHPEKIYLFGSYADGTATEDSDLDLAVIINNNLSNFENIIKIRSLLKDIDNPLDIITYHENEFKEKILHNYLFESRIDTEGVKLYG